jgi:hypothetical protein
LGIVFLNLNLDLESKYFSIINSEFLQLVDLIAKQKKSEPIKILLFCSECYLNKYLKLYLDLVKFNENFSRLFKHYFVPRRLSLVSSNSTTSMLVNYLGKSNNLYNSLFIDELWCHVTSAPISNNLERFKEILNRLKKYVNCPNEMSMPLQIGEVMINDEVNSKFIPFLIDIRIGVLGQPSQTYEGANDGGLVSECQPQPQQLLLPPPSLVHKNSLSTSNSMPHFLTNVQQSSPMNSHQSVMNKSRYSPPSSPLTTSSGFNSGLNMSEEGGNGYNLQLDYWY